ncbi:carbohydrate ABC transporter permease [Agathobaculum sp. Marseille-P7918]|uniref:carbohydrate ABC transporter permease n=1 Tax=Agathobaculum sp. Marseille-P7918 TaxID=2479843 RepID=UPI000F63F0A8|nr:sugar ABC transporter permease [Agathobaculum sp. Marseille-P7918]
MSGKNKAVRYSAKKRNEAWWGYLMVLPTILGLIVLNIIPIFQTIYQSFFKTGDFGKGNIFIGLQNYITLIHDSSVWQAVWNTIRYTIVEVPISIVIALLLAVLLNRKMKCRVAFRTIYFLPMIAAPAAVAMVWRWLYNSQFGLLNHILGIFGFGPVNWISDPKIAIYSVAVVGIWSVIGYNMVLFLAGLQEIPKDYYEAARIDGANSVQQFFNVTIPLLSPTLFFVLVTRLIAAMQVFDVIYMMMDLSNPALGETQSLVYLFYNYSFIEGNKGYGSTIVILLLMIIMVITLFQNYLEKKWVHYN